MCVYVHACAREGESERVCDCAYGCVSDYVCNHVCVYTTYLKQYVCVSFGACICVCMYACMHVTYIYICLCVYVCAYRWCCMCFIRGI